MTKEEERQDITQKNDTTPSNHAPSHDSASTIQETIQQAKAQDKHNLDQDEMDFIGDIKAAILFKKTHFAGTLLYVLVLFFVCMAVWAHFAIIDEMTTGEGKVVPSSQVKKIQSLEAGIVTEVLVSQGERVKKGQVLLKLDDTRFAATYREQKQRYAALLAQAARLKAEIAGQDHIEYPEEVAVAGEKIIEEENKLFKQRKANIKHAIDTLKHNFELAQKEVDITAPLVKEGVISRIELLRLQRQVNDIKGELEEKGEIFKEEAQTELNKINGELASLSETLVSEKDRMLRTTIYSPVNGLVKDIHVSTIGQIVQSGRDIMEIVPIEDSLMVEARVRPSDIGFIHPGQSAMVKITAYDFSIYGGLKGKVAYISPDTIIDDKGETFFEILVKTNRNYLGSKAKPLPISSGMTATVHVLTGKKSILKYILKPLIKGRQNAFTER